MDNFENDVQNFDMDDIEKLRKTIEQSQALQEQNDANAFGENQIDDEYDHHDFPEAIPELAHWEDFCEENNVLKKYIMYISKDFVDIMDSMTTDERTAYINDAIQKKLDFEDEKFQFEKKKSMVIHVVIAFITLMLFMPFLLVGANKAIMHTFDNYRYSQDNFERLYKHRFEKEKAYIKTLQHNLINNNSSKRK